MDIKQLIDIEMNLSEESIKNFPWETENAYCSWLAQTFYMVSHSTRLVAYASAFTDLNNNSQHNRFLDHAKEEKGHEVLCINDLKKFSKTPTDYKELAATKALYHSQYYYIGRTEPTSLMGYILYLECLSTHFGPHIYNCIKESFGAKAGSFMKVHAEEDVGHVESAYQLINSLPEIEKKTIAENLTLSGELYRAMMSKITQSSKNNFRDLSAAA